MPQWGELGADTWERMRLKAGTLSQTSATLELDYLNAALAAWLERRRLQALATADVALDTFRRRCAVMGFRAGMIAHALYSDAARSRGRSQERIVAFACYVADYSLAALLARYGRQINDADESDTPEPVSLPVYERLPETFTRADLHMLLAKLGRKTASRKLLYLWKKNGMIEETDKRCYTKILKS